MKNLKVFGLVFMAILATIYIGANGFSANNPWGPFFIFVGACCLLGFTIDVFNHLRTKGSR